MANDRKELDDHPFHMLLDGVNHQMTGIELTHISLTLS
jgi:hypothetical protein